MKAQLVSFQVGPKDFALEHKMHTCDHDKVRFSFETITVFIFISGRGEGSHRHPSKFFSI